MFPADVVRNNMYLKGVKCVSDRDDIDVVGSAENNAEPNSADDKKTDNSSSNSSNNNQAIRQNPLTHSDEKPAKKGFFEKLKRAFSADDGSSTAEEKINNNTDINITDNNNNTVEKTDARDISKEAEFDPEEEEEFKMISAFLEGEDYVSPIIEEKAKSENSVVKTEEKTETKVTEAKTEEKNETVHSEFKVEEKTETVITEIKIEEKTNSEAKPKENKINEYDSQNALENEETNFDVQSAFDNEEAEFIMIDIDDDEEFSDDLDDISEEDKKSEDKLEEVKAEEKIEDKPEKLKAEEKTEDKPEEVKTEEKTEDKPEEVKTEEKTEDKPEEVKTEEKTEDKPDEVKTEEKTEDKPEELKAEEKTENKPEEVKTEEKTENKPEELKAEEKTENKPEEVKPEEKTEVKPEELKAEEKTEDKPEEIKPEEKTENKPEEVKPEEKTEVKPEEVKTEEKTEVKSEEVKPEEKTEVKPEEPNKNSDGIQVESINADGDKSQSDDEFEDDDEEFRFEEDYVFDESDDDDDLEDLANLDDVDDFKDLEGLFNTSQQPKDKSSEVKSEEISEEKKEDNPTENNSENGNDENSAEKKIPEESKSEEKSDAAENKDEPQENNPLENQKAKPEENPESKSESAEKSEESSAGEKHNEFVDISSNSGSGESKADNAKKKVGSAFGKIKSAFVKSKKKIVELWNTKEDGSIENKDKNPETISVTPTEPTPTVTEAAEPFAEKTETVKDNVIDITAAASESKSESDSFDKYGEVFESDSENTEITPVSGDGSDVVDISENNVSAENNAQAKIIPMKVIKNENAAVVPIDREKVRESLSVIESEKTISEPDILTDEQKHQLEMNKKVLEKVKQYEEESAERREELRKARAERSAKDYNRAFGTVDPITEIEIDNYIDTDKEEFIKVKAGKFTESVRSEYEFYVGYTKLKDVARKQTKVEPVKPTLEPGVTVQSIPSVKPADTEKIKLDESSYAEFSEDKFAKSRDRLESISKRLDYKDSKHPDTLEYRTEDDAVKIKKILQENLKKAKMQWNVSIGLTFAMFVLCCIGGAFGVGAGEAAKDSSLRGFAFVNLAIYAAMLYNCRDIIVRGLQPLKKIKSNSDTGYAIAAVVTVFQSVTALINPTPFFRQGLNVYTLVVMLALALNTLGRQRNADRISSNFRFVSDSSQKYTGKFFHNQRMVATLLSGTKNDKSELVFQKKTAFLKHFMKLSHSPDPGEDLADKFSLPTIVFSIVISIVYLLLSKSFADTISVFSIMLCAAVPMCSKALGAVPLHKLAKNSLANQSMVVGYQAVESFSESAAVMLDAKELYPEGSVHLNGIKTFDSRRIDEAMHAAASVIITAGGAMAGMFDGIIQGDKLENLPQAENVIYEDGKGLIGWVNNERIFIGNRQLLRSHDIETMSEEYEAEQRSDGDEILYLACAGELVAMFIVGYSANRRVADALRRMEANGMSMLIRTTDVNITAERIAKDFGVSHRSIKILEQKNSNVVRDEMIGKEKSSPAFVATKGGVTSFGRAVSGCIQTKRNILLSLAVQVFGVLLGLLIVTVIALVSGVHHIGAIQMFFFYLFWAAAVLAAPPIIQKFQKY